MADELRLLAVFPNPDDEILGLGGTLAKYAAEGVSTYLVCATRGERGWFESEGPDPGLEAVGRVREGELRCAAERLGLQDVCILDYLDGEVDQAKAGVIIAGIVRQIWRWKPHVIVSFPPDGDYGHLDHIARSQFTAAAIMCAADASFKDESNQASHRTQKFYYVVHSEEGVQFAKDRFGGLSMEVDGTRRTDVGWAYWEITTHVDARPHMSIVRSAVLCHRSPLCGYGPLVHSSAEELIPWFGTGDFYRVFSLTNGGRGVETDLFEGLR